MILNKNTSSYRVYIEDTDLMGIIYHARYLYFFERARTDFLRANGITLTNMAKEDIYFAIAEINIKYTAPGRLDDVVSIETSIEKKRGCSLLLHQVMINQNQEKLALAEVTVITVDKLLKPKRVIKTVFGGEENG